MTRRISRVVSGDSLSAAAWNQIGESIDRLNDQDLREAIAELTRRLDALVPVPGLFTIVSLGPGITEFQVVSGVEGIPSGSEPTLTMRPPPELIEASRGTLVYSYTDLNNRDETTTTESQTLIPPYLVGDTLEAFYWDADGALVDRNVAGRAWAADDIVFGP